MLVVGVHTLRKLGKFKLFVVVCFILELRPGWKNVNGLSGSMW